MGRTEQEAQPLLVVSDISKRLRVRDKWVYDAVAAGRLPHYRVGRYLRFDTLEIEQWIKATRRGKK
jgi:excisionase family DNA binding protein